MQSRFDFLNLEMKKIIFDMNYFFSKCKNQSLVTAIEITVNNQTELINKNICYVVNFRVSDRVSMAHCDIIIECMNETSSLRTNETYGRKFNNEQHYYK